MHYLHNHESGAQIVFGLDWSPLIGGDPEKQAIQRARALDATHYVVAGSSHGRAVGAVRIQSEMHAGQVTLHSAAAIFAMQFPHGAVGRLISVKDGACWMLVCHAGAVLSHTDKWFADEQQALAALEPIRLRFPALQIFHESVLDIQQPASWLSAGLTDDSVLNPVRQTQGYLKKYFFLSLLILLLAVGACLYLYEQGRVQPVQVVDIQGAWRLALTQQSANQSWHRFAHLQAVIDSWMKIPLVPMGWRLRKIQCESHALLWECAAQFAREHRMALNSHLDSVKPEGWRLEFTPLEQGTYFWQVNQPLEMLDMSESWMSIDWMSYLQSVGSVFEHIQVGQSVVIPIISPVDPFGQSIPKPENFPIWKKRALSLKGPLRAFATLEKFYMPVRWRRATLVIDRQIPQGINRSALTLELIGDMFETHKK